MVTCPWCATVYKEYQPACEKCGGPIPEAAAPVEPVTPIEKELPLPPSPPRPFSDSYAWRMLTSEGGAIAIGIPFMLLGVIMLGVGGVILMWRYQCALVRVAILRRGLATRGEISRVERIAYYRVNRQHPWEISYRYR